MTSKHDPAKSLPLRSDKEHLAFLKQSADSVRQSAAQITTDADRIITSLQRRADRRKSLREAEAILAASEQRLEQVTEMIAAQEAPTNHWQEAVIDALVCDFLLNENNKNDPRQAVRDLVDWNVKLGRDALLAFDDTRLEEVFHQHASCIAGRAHVDLQGFIKAVRSLS